MELPKEEKQIDKALSGFMQKNGTFLLDNWPWSIFF